ncbi:MAG TPA: RsmG family class I SAM-dependent methyltransferase [Pyrinomonadaceae bacterium]|nr:RsmG family class I SAM-dependent methyltransferase [Pyrinomonadaceae bacterium]
MNGDVASDGRAGETLSMRQEFIAAIRANKELFGVELSDQVIERLADYYQLVQEANPILHLAAPSTPEVFATRHILESLTLLKHLPTGARFGDIGPGAGLPSIPCLIARDDLTAVLIESKEKKSKFLESAASNLFDPKRVEVINLQFEEVREHDLRVVTCRALDKFVDKLPGFVKWAKGARLFLFGGHGVREGLDKLRIKYDTETMPLSEQRFLLASRESQKKQ